MEGPALLRHEDGGLSCLPVTARVSVLAAPECTVVLEFERYARLEAILRLNLAPDKALALAERLWRSALCAQIAQRGLG